MNALAFNGLREFLVLASERQGRFASRLSRLRLWQPLGRGCLLILLVSALGLLRAETASATEWGSPTKALAFTLPGFVLEMAIVDLNGDGLPDIVAASGYIPTQNTS